MGLGDSFLLHMVAASVGYGCSLCRIRLQVMGLDDSFLNATRR